MHPSIRVIDSPASMSEAIRHVGIIPLVRNTIPGWSVEEMTAPGCWFMDDDAEGVLGPWDWKIEVIREGDIAYGKFIRNKAAFATVEWYRHLMNWRRSLPVYRMALGEDYPARTQMERLFKHLSPVLLSAIRELGCVNGGDIRKILSERTTAEQRKKIAGGMEKYLLPEVRRPAADYLNRFLEMGTWTVVGDFERVYRGPAMEYKGWQKSSITTPDDLFCSVQAGEEQPFWASAVEDSSEISVPDCSPEESRAAIIEKIRGNFPAAGERELQKLI